MASVNRILSSLPDDVATQLLRHANKVDLRRGDVLHEPFEQPHFAYFPLTGVCSVVTRTSSGHAVETGMLGDEGCTGTAYVMGPSEVPSQYVQQVPGISLRIPFADFHTVFRECEPMRNCILALMQVWTLSMGQMVACQRLHNAEERLARWLLMARQRSRTDTFQLSHEFLAEMLGSGRPKITLLLLAFREAGLVDSQRNGTIRITDVTGLEATACECHGVITRIYDGLYGDGLYGGSQQGKPTHASAWRA